MAWVQAWVREWVKARVKAWVKAGMGPGSYLFNFNSILNHTYHGPRDRGGGGIFEPYLTPPQCLKNLCLPSVY